MTSKSFLQNVIVGGMLLLSVTAGSIGVSYAAFTEVDLQDAVSTKDTAGMKKIVDDPATDPYVRWHAVQEGLAKEDWVKYIDADFVLSNRDIMTGMYAELRGRNLLPIDRYQMLVVAAAGLGLENEWVFQDDYVGKLMQAGQLDKAVVEARRLYGIAPINPDLLSRSVNRIAAIVKAKAIKDGKSPRDAFKEMNGYLEAVGKNDVAGHWFTKIVPPPLAPDPRLAKIAPMGNESEPVVLLLYSGKYDEARAAADTYFANAGPEDAQMAVGLVAACINGKAGSPTAANEFINSLR